MDRDPGAPKRFGLKGLKSTRQADRFDAKGQKPLKNVYNPAVMAALNTRGGAIWLRQAPCCTQGHQMKLDQSMHAFCALCRGRSSSWIYVCPIQGCKYSICMSCREEACDAHGEKVHVDCLDGTQDASTEAALENKTLTTQRSQPKLGGA